MTAPDVQPTGPAPAQKPLTAREKLKINLTPIHDPLIGQVIGGHYEVMECIGRGGMSAVYKCRHQLINQFRAVKVLLPHRDSEGDCLLRFQLEATAASRLDNRHIVRVHDFVAPVDSAPYLVMDFAEGQGLGDEIDKLGRLPTKRSLAIFVQILDAIGHTHARGVIHRDLKPDNILLVNDEIDGPDYVKLIDFGIAKLTAADKLQPQGLTPTGEVFGSPQYMSPEQCAGLNLDVRSEIYSMGCILYEMLSGKAPLLGKSVLETLNMQAHTPPTPLAKLPIDPPLKVPPELDRILMRCLAKKPEDRYQTTEELRKAITKLPTFDRRRHLQAKMVSQASPNSLAVIGMVAAISFCIGVSAARLIPGYSQLTNSPGEGVEPASGATAQWQSLYVAGQKALDEGELATASTKLDDALTRANALNDGQKRAAATGLDLVSLDLIRQLKNLGPNDLTSLVRPTNSYPDNPWETRVGAVLDLLRLPIKDQVSETPIIKATMALLEDAHKGNLAMLDELLKLAAARLDKSPGLKTRDKVNLAILIAGIQEERGYFKLATDILKAQESQLTDSGGASDLAGKYHLLRGRLAFDEGNYDQAKIETKKAQVKFDEDISQYTDELIEAAVLSSDIKLAKRDVAESLRQAKQALSSIDSAHPSDYMEALKDKLLTRTALLDPPGHLKTALARCDSELEQQEGQAPKAVPRLITALTMAYSLSNVQDSPGITSRGRTMLWRAATLALATGRLALASALMQPLMLSYDTPLTRKDMLKLAINRFSIDENLAKAGNKNGGALLLDDVALGEAFQDFSLGTERNPKKSHAYLEQATGLIDQEENRGDKLVVSHVLYNQAKLAEDRKSPPAIVAIVLKQAKSAVDEADSHQVLPDKQRARDIQNMIRKIKELDGELAKIKGANFLP